MLDASITGNGTAVEEPPFDTSQQGSSSTPAGQTGTANSNAKFSTGTGGALLAVTTQAYESIKDPVEWAKVTGQAIHMSGMFGCVNAAQGYVMAMDAWTRRVPILQFAQTYHIVEGKLTMRADSILARFLEAGNRIAWKKTGEDGQEAVATFWDQSQTKYTIGYTIQEATLAGLVKPGSNWVKRPGEMLRARLVSKAVRMVDPRCIAGVYTPEDFDVSEDGLARLKPDVATMVAVENLDNVPRIVHTTALAPTQAAPVAPAQSASAPIQAEQPKALTSQVDAIRQLANDLKMPMDAYYSMLAKRGVKSPDELTIEQAFALIKAMSEKLIAAGPVVTAPGTPGVTIGTPLTPLTPTASATPAAPESKLNMPIVPGSPGYITTEQSVRISELRQALNMTDAQWVDVLRKRKLNGTHELPEADAAEIIAKLEHKLALANPNTDPRAVVDAQKTAELTAWASGATLPNPQGRPQTAAPGPSA